MKKLFYKIEGISVVILMIMAFALQPIKAQDHDFEGWQVYDAYTKMNTGINFEAWIFETKSIREDFGLSYIIGYMNGVNGDDFYSYFYKDKIKSEKWYQKGRIDGFLDRFLYQRGQCISLQLLTADYFNFFDYMMPFRAVRSWLSALSIPQYFIPIFACIPNVSSRLYAFEHYKKREIVYGSNPSEKPSRSPNDYRDIEEHKNIPLSRLAEVPEYEPTEKPTRSENDYRNIEEHTTVSVTSLTNDIDLRLRINQRTRNNNRNNNSVLRRVYQDWPELREYVKSNRLSNIRIIGSIEDIRSVFNIKKATIEIALPGRQFDNNFNRRLLNSLNIDLSEFENRTIKARIRRDNNVRRSTSFRNSSDRVKSQATVEISTRSANRTKGQRSNTGSSSHDVRIEHN